MTKLTEVAEATYQLAMELSNGGLRNSVYFIIREGDAVLIEPGPSALVPRIRKGIEQLGIQRLTHIIPTHIHMDHAGGTGDLAALYPEAKVVLHPRAARHAINPERLIAATKLSSGDDFEDTHGSIRPVPESQIKTAEDGEILDIGDRELQIIHAPGHAAHQIAIFDHKPGALFCGEALGILMQDEDWALPSVSTPELDVPNYLATIDKLRRLEPRMLLYSHNEGSRVPEPLISRLAENTALLRDMVLEGLKNGNDLKTIERRVRRLFAEHIATRTWPHDGTTPIRGISGMVEGYANYFERQGLV